MCAKQTNTLLTKDMIQKELMLQLTQALPSLKEAIGEKKFDKRIKKAAKMLGEGIKHKEKVNAGPNDKTGGKNAEDKKTTVKSVKATAPKKTVKKASRK